MGANFLSGCGDRDDPIDFVAFRHVLTEEYLLVNAFLFVFFSICCGQTRSLELMILFRVMQGFTGGVLIPLSFDVLLTYLSSSKQPIGMALFTVTANLLLPSGRSSAGG